MDARVKFDDYIKLFASNNSSKNQPVFSDERYEAMVANVKAAVEIPHKQRSEKQKKLLKRYAIVAVEGVDKLVSPGKAENEYLFFVKQAELFDVIKQHHENIGHRGRFQTISELDKKYANVTQWQVRT